MKRLLFLAAFSLFSFGISACHNAEADKQAAAQEAQMESMQMELVKRRAVDSVENAAKVAAADKALEEKQVVAAPVEKAVAKAPVAPRRSRRASTRRSSNTDYNNNSGSTSGANNGYSSAPAPVYQEPAPAPAPVKKGWSAKAKGAVIGAGVGAVGGAILDKKNRGVGALIGGAAGAILGTGAGAVIDKKKGR